MPETPGPLHLGLVGWPLGHSISPRLHDAALHALDLPGEYSLFPLPPTAEGEKSLRQLLERMRQEQLHGLNVTIPHKQTVIPMLDDLTPRAKAIGAVNTIYNQKGRLWGENTDAPGFMTDLEKYLPGAADGKGAQALVMGAGGSARAVVYALAQAGWAVTIAARRIEQGQALAHSLRLPGVQIKALPFEDATFSANYSLVVNTTPLGMFPEVKGNPWPAEVPFPRETVLYDLVYNPLETALVRAARQAGLQAATGLGMLVEQAAIAFEIWTRREAPGAAMWAAAQIPEFAGQNEQKPDPKGLQDP
jgi:shikimate dehydrogenase